jgi:hypothetical protein
MKPLRPIIGSPEAGRHKNNRDGIGAQIKLSTDIGDQYATVTTAGSYQSSSDVRVHFGLGAAATIKLLHVRWPSGIVQI